MLAEPELSSIYTTAAFSQGQEQKREHLQDERYDIFDEPDTEPSQHR
jgi:hypothetical protein